MAKKLPERTTMVLVLCILGFIGFALGIFTSLMVLFIDYSALTGIDFPLWYKIYGLVSVLITFVALLYMFYMKRFGLYLYTFMMLLSIVITQIIVGLNLNTLFSMIVGITFVVLFWTQYKKMV